GLDRREVVHHRERRPAPDLLLRGLHQLQRLPEPLPRAFALRLLLPAIRLQLSLLLVPRRSPIRVTRGAEAHGLGEFQTLPVYLPTDRANPAPGRPGRNRRGAPRFRSRQPRPPGRSACGAGPRRRFARRGPLTTARRPARRAR